MWKSFVLVNSKTSILERQHFASLWKMDHKETRLETRGMVRTLPVKSTSKIEKYLDRRGI